MCCKAETTKTTATDVHENAADQAAVAKAVAVADKPFESYTAPRVADLSSGQTDAIAGLSKLISESPNTIVQGMDWLKQAATAPAQKYAAANIDPTTIKDSIGDIPTYFNPYAKVVNDQSMLDIDKTTDASLKRLNSSATAAGSFGDARHWGGDLNIQEIGALTKGRVSSEAAERMWKDALATLGADVNIKNAAGLANAGFLTDANKSNAQFAETALQRLAAGAQGQEALAAADQNRQLQQLQALLNVGGLQQGNEQAKLDARFAEFIRQYNHDPAMAQLLSQVGKNAPHDSNGTETTSTPDNTGLGIAGAIIPALLTGGATLPMTLGATAAGFPTQGITNTAPAPPGTLPWN